MCVRHYFKGLTHMNAFYPHDSKVAAILKMRKLRHKVVK